MKWIIVFLFVIICGGIVVWRSDTPPLEEIENSRKILAKADRLNAGIYCCHLYQGAREKYEIAMKLWKQENNKLFFLRSFDSVRIYAGQVAEDSRLAIEKSVKIQQSTRKEVLQEISELRQEMSAFEKIFMSLPLDRKLIRRHSQGKFLLNEAELAFEKEDYPTGRQKSREAASMLRTSYTGAKQLLDKYFRQLLLWQEQLEKILEESRQKEIYVVVIQKIPATCCIYYKGLLRYTFPVEFGKNWLGNKCYEGDFATPEGNYQVIKCLQKPMTRYYKALLLDYPNAEDLERFKSMQKTGALSVRARPGNLIEIHGEGGRGANWTNGCIALKNEDMDVVYRAVRKGTPVLIIGAKEKFEEIQMEGADMNS